MAFQLTPLMRARFDKEVAKYPPEQKASAVMACLSIVQDTQGWVSPESEQAVGEYLGMPAIAVHEVTTFYNMYNQQPVGAGHPRALLLVGGVLGDFAREARQGGFGERPSTTCTTSSRSAPSS